MACGAALRLFGLTSRSLWFDEANTLCVALLPLADILPAVRRLEGFPPLHYLALHGWLGFFGDPLWGLRSFSALCGLTALGAFHGLCRRAAPERLIPALFLASFSPFWTHISQDARTYALLLLLSLLAAQRFLVLQEAWSRRGALAYAGLSILGLYTHNFFAFFLLADAAYLGLRFRRRPGGLKPWLAVYGLVLAAYAPWFSSLLIQTRSWAGISVLQQGFGLGQLNSMLGTMLCDTGFLGFMHENWTRAAGGFILLLSAAGVLRLPRPGPERQAALFCLVHVAVPLAAAKAAELLLGKALTQPRYFVFVSPFLYIWLAIAVARLPAALRPLLRTALAALVLAGAAGYAAAGFYLDPRLSELSRRIRLQADRRWPVVHLDPYYYTPMRFYYLPDRAHFLARPFKGLNWEALPGYPALISRRELESLGRCVVVDPQRTLFPQRYGAASGRDLLRRSGWP